MVRRKRGHLLVAIGMLLTMSQGAVEGQTLLVRPPQIVATAVPPASEGSPASSDTPIVSATQGPAAMGSAPNSGPAFLPPSTFPETMPPSVTALPLEAFQDIRWTPPPGWFTNLDLGLAFVHLQNHLTGQVFVGGNLNLFQLPTADLDVIVTPRIGVGYRLPHMGEITLTYQSITGQGTETLPDFNGTGPAGLRSRLNVNVADLEWWGSEISLGPLWDMKWHVGVRYANIYSDSQATSAALMQGASNLFNGAGPIAGLDLWRALPPPGLALYGRIVGAYLIGPVHQSYEEGTPGFYTVNHAATGSAPVAGGLNTNTATPMILDVEAGLGYTPPWAHWVRLSAGYQFQQWWNLGVSSIPNFPNMPADVQFTSHAIFFRAEIHY
jgi:hypothetical protein